MVRKSRQDLSNVRGFVSFISSSGNGHSLISSMIDAHRDAVVCREQSILTRVYKNDKVPSRRFYQAIINSSKLYTENGRFHKGSQTSHIIPNQFNGQSTSPQIVGDKHGFGVTMMLVNNQDFTEVIEDRLNIPIYYIHVHRNPFDVIAHLIKFYTYGLKSTIHRVLARFKRVDEALQKVKNVLSIDFADLALNPRNTLSKILAFLKLDPYRGFVRDCISAINLTKVIERNEINWTPGQINQITTYCAPFTYLNCAHE